jgi:hypothetical protein
MVVRKLQGVETDQDGYVTRKMRVVETDQDDCPQAAWGREEPK